MITSGVIGDVYYGIIGEVYYGAIGDSYCGVIDDTHHGVFSDSYCRQLHRCYVGIACVWCIVWFCCLY